MTDYTPDPSYDPNTPVVATYQQNSNILYTDPATGALVFPTEILTGTFSSAAQSTQNTQSITNLVANADPASNIILTGKSSSGVSMNYSNLLTTLNTLNKTVGISTSDKGHLITVTLNGTNYQIAYDNLLYFLNTTAPIDSPTFTGTVRGITAAMVGLGNVNNTSDANKPISNATQTALNLVASLAAPLASPTFTGTATAPTINATTSLKVGGIDISTIYQTISGMASYITSSSLTTTLGSYATKASPTFTGTVSGITAAMVGLGNVNNTSDANKPISTATQTALNLLAPLASPTFTGTVSGITAAMVGLGNVNNTSDANKPISTATQTALNLLAPKASPAFTGTVTYGGTDLDTLYKPWVIATIDGTTGNVSSSSGKATVSCSRTAAGSYTVSYTSTPSGAPSAVLLTLRNSTGFVQYSGLSGSSMNVSTRNTSSTLTDATFSIVAYL